MIRQLLILSLSLTVALAQFGPIDIPAAADNCIRRSRCVFFPCAPRPIIFFTAKNFASFPPICRRNQDIGAIEINEPSVRTVRGSTVSLTKLSAWNPSGLSNRFRADTFAPKQISSLVDNSGLTRQHILGNQNKFTHGTCFQVPVKRYALVKKNGVRFVDTSNPSKDCFVFVANTPDIVFEAQWFNTGDDLDLEVTEPDGTVIDYLNPRSTSGRFNGGDKNIDGCELKAEEREKVEYFRSNTGFQTGKYKMTLRHRTNCEEGLTKWYLRVLVDGRVVASKDGNSSGDLGEIIDTLEYTV